MSKKKKTALRIVLIGGGVILLAAIVLVGIYFFAPKSDPKYIAHMGYRSVHPDNTEDAFLAAAGMDFYGIETDIRKTQDGYFVCNHDETVKFADGTEMEVKSSTRDELLSKPLKNDKTDSEVYLCTFERYLDICKSGGKVAFIELKVDYDEADVLRILQIVDERYDRASVSVISFEFDALLRMRQADPHLDLQYLSETKNDPNFDRCPESGISIDVRQRILTPTLVRKFHKAGLTVNTWTVNKEFDQNLVRLKKVDYVTTDVFDK